MPEPDKAREKQIAKEKIGQGIFLVLELYEPNYVVNTKRALALAEIILTVARGGEPSHPILSFISEEEQKWLREKQNG